MSTTTHGPFPPPGARSAVRLGGPGELAAAIPYLLGFHPRESVVGIGLSGPRNTVCLVLRFDLPEPADEAAAATVLAGHLRGAGAASAVVAVVTDEPALPGELPRARLAEVLDDGLAGAGVRTDDVLCVAGDRWSSYLCRDRGCRPPEGKPVRPADLTALAAATVVDGTVVFADRAELSRSLAPLDEAVGTAGRARFARAEARHRRKVARVGALRAANPAMEELARAVAAGLGRPASLPEATVARCCVVLADVNARDACLRWIGGPEAPAAEAIWQNLTRRAAPPYGAAPATLLALYAYARGDGTLARMAAERALEHDAAYPMAQLVLDALSNAVPPAQISALGQDAAWPPPEATPPSGTDLVPARPAARRGAGAVAPRGGGDDG